MSENYNVKCSYDEIVELHKLQPNPKNPNQHPKKQIDIIAKVIDFQGQRHPIIVSKRTGFIVAGHGRLEALKQLSWSHAAVNYQDFENEAEEYAFIVADNATQELSELNKTDIFDQISFFEDFDIEQLGMSDIFKESTKKENKNDDEVDLEFSYKIEIDCITEDNQKLILAEMEDRGFKVRLLI